ncbi:hypothetical protein [Clostridium botulinum]|uniref:Uncharacterized protein n=1 Tax=Clostridium botulinum TaxID=1491 RepID=A0A0M1M2L3_CLOBO|nr:hypothetical protein [Clostridium botulinum]KOR64109.1 hypothetical protein ADT22_01705 [Clostridium botulinum]MCS6112550.1 hypothetical protein [Clostridium botulinum]NFF88711.1 hypothetical protein [Clostridium botulinum]NFG11215.1 hypothetical protein [Clostridium botulinum]NFL43407.1 hypothetical protein [Clostridium botulinum]
MGIKEDFMKKTKMVDANNNKLGVEEIIDYLVCPETINKMIIASEMELPVLTLIAKDLEKIFDKNSNFPVVINGNNKNSTARQNVGRIIKYIMKQYGYTLIVGGLSERARIPAISGAEYFSTSGIYKKTAVVKYKIEVITKKI